MENMVTPFDKICEILTDLWLNYREDEDAKDLFDYFDIGFPLAFANYEKLCELSDDGYAIVSATWWGVLDAFAITEDIGFETLFDIIGSRNKDIGDE